VGDINADRKEIFMTTEEEIEKEIKELKRCKNVLQNRTYFDREEYERVKERIKSKKEMIEKLKKEAALKHVEKFESF
jgi:ppGpp synthetase/RelA/SpoT-type nucleotidyltranferase